MNGSFDRAGLVRLFDELSKELLLAGTRAQIYIIGGAAMSLAFSQARRTEDVDARIDKGHARLTEAVRTVGRRHGIGDSWLNEQATWAIPRATDVRAQTLYQSAYLTVTGASAKHLLAMKLEVGRTKDREDIAVLCRHLGLRDPEEALGIHQELFPEGQVTHRARGALEAAFRGRDVGFER